MNQFTKPGERGIASVRVLLAQIPIGWQKRKDARVDALIERAIAELSSWTADTDLPVAALQRGATFSILALQQALAGQSPPFTPLPETSDDLPAPHPNSRPKRRYRRAEMEIANG